MVDVVDVVNEMAKGGGKRRTVIEHSSPTDSQGNGLIERGVRCVEETTRVIKFQLEQHLTPCSTLLNVSTRGL